MSVFSGAYKREKCISQSCYYLLCSSLPEGVVPTAPELPTGEMENQTMSPTAVSDPPPDYNSHFVPGKVNCKKNLPPEHHTKAVLRRAPRKEVVKVRITFSVFLVDR